MTILYKLLEDGAFVVGDSVTGETNYAYPSSEFAALAAQNPALAAVKLAREANAEAAGVSAWVRDRFNAYQWRRLGCPQAPGRRLT